MSLTRITFSGPDEMTDLDALRELAKDPRVEFGLLFTVSPDGRRRYPSAYWLEEMAKALSGRCALHVCGGRARQLFSTGALHHFTKHTPRVQVNGKVEPDELVSMSRYAGTIMTQHCRSNEALVGVGITNHAMLVDSSGGNGVSPDSWKRPETHKEVGFAGGLGSENIIHELFHICEVARGKWWVDMEGKLRTDDWFDVEKARAVLQRIS